MAFARLRSQVWNAHHAEAGAGTDGSVGGGGEEGDGAGGGVVWEDVSLLAGKSGAACFGFGLISAGWCVERA